MEKTGNGGKETVLSMETAPLCDFREEVCPEMSDGAAKPLGGGGGDLREPEQTLAEQGQDYSFTHFKAPA